MKHQDKSLQDQLLSFKKEIISLSYEDTLESLDKILSEFKNDSIPLKELQEYYVQAKVYLEHAQSLLEDVEQSVSQIDLDALNKVSDKK